ncbi:MAG: 50S ribosomal protein L38e [Candidatus Heimdallarchaeota archaeon]
MPEEIKDLKKLDAIIDQATECRVKRIGDIVKLKFRTKKKLYTIKVTVNEAEAIRARISVPIVDY